MEDLTLKQLWWLVKFAKHIRGRCRSNTALNNYLNRNFSAQFREVSKTFNGRTFMGLQIIKDGESLEDKNDGE